MRDASRCRYLRCRIDSLVVVCVVSRFALAGLLRAAKFLSLQHPRLLSPLCVAAILGLPCVVFQVCSFDEIQSCVTATEEAWLSVREHTKLVFVHVLPDRPGFGREGIDFLVHQENLSSESVWNPLSAASDLAPCACVSSASSLVVRSALSLHTRCRLK